LVGRERSGSGVKEGSTFAGPRSQGAISLEDLLWEGTVPGKKKKNRLGVEKGKGGRGGKNFFQETFEGHERSRKS